MQRIFRTPAFFIILSLFLPVSRAGAQDWIRLMQDPDVNFYDVQRSFNKYMEKMERKKKRKGISPQEEEEGIPGLVQYKRWEHFMAPRVYPTGNRNQLFINAETIQQFYQTYKLNPDFQMQSNWSLLGPVNTIPTNGGCGRINCVRVDPTNQNIIYVGAPAGGLWKTTNGGLSWNTSTDGLACIGVSDVAIDPSNNNIVYIATGDNDAGDTYTIGVLKSVDGAQTWMATGLNFNVTSSGRVTRLLIHPTSPQILYASTGSGIYKTTDGGASWVKVMGASVKDMEFKPGDPGTIYACTSNSFHRSIDNGTTWTTVSSGLPGSNICSRLAIAVTENDPNYVYVLISKQSGYGYLGLYRSTNSGNSFSLRSNSPNLLGWDTQGQDNDGQGWYTLSIDVSPVNKEEIIVGGVNIWKSADGGQNWALDAHWYGGGGAPYVHADIHDLSYGPNSSIYFAACDGGLFKTSNSGNSYTDLSAGLQIAQQYRLGTSVTNPTITLTGHQDNGTNLCSSGSWDQVFGGDGMECFIDWSNPNNMYVEYQYGVLQMSSDGGNSFTQINSMPETGQWVTPWCQDPINPNTIYAGMDNVWKSTNQGQSWTQISNFSNMGITILAVAPSNSQVIYAASSAALYKTTDGGISWSNMTPLLPSSSFMQYLAVSATDPDKIWLTFGGYNPTVKVFKSVNGGNSWTNLLSNTLPNLPVNCVVSQTGTNDGVYIGTDVGVYYYDETIANWTYFSNGLPNVIIDELEIQYSSGKLRAATFGRGLWETGLYNPASTAPLANFSASQITGCPGFTVQFTDLSTNNPTSWNWSFPGGTPSTSTAQNPTVTYSVGGTYNNVKLIASNANGTDSIIKNSYIKVSPLIIPTITLTANDTICSNQNLLLLASSGVSYFWTPTFQSTYLVHPVVSGTYQVTVTDAFGCTATSLPVNIVIYPAPAAPVITMNNDTLCAPSFDGYQWYLNGTPLTGETQQCHTVTQPGNYYVVVRDTNGCTATSNTLVGVKENAGQLFGLTALPNPSYGEFSIYYELPAAQVVIITVQDVAGRLVFENKTNCLPGKTSQLLDLNYLPKGVYTLTLFAELGKTTIKLVVK